jgi:hypothetical protein
MCWLFRRGPVAEANKRALFVANCLDLSIQGQFGTAQLLILRQNQESFVKHGF